MEINKEQAWVEQSWKKSSKTITEKDELLFLMEEIGEVAESLRKINGNKHKGGELEKEFGDVLLSIMTLANRYSVNLETAFEKTKQSIIERYENNA